ncbi:MAG: hypothetical protein K0S11_782, partial [Gammaproteobacteria bacterium]|nr:hypothetical protein [Gammaproteobacteria bacterium]
LSYLSNSDTFAVIMPDLIEIRAIIKTNFGNLSEHFSDHATAIELNTLDDAKQAIFNKINASIQRDDATKEDWFEFYSFLYFLRRINDSIRELMKY